MTARDITDYIANECSSIPYFEYYKSETEIVVGDANGNKFKVTVERM